MQPEILNRVAESSLVTMNLEEYYPKGETIVFDLKDYLLGGFVLKEKEFRIALQNTTWEKYESKLVALTCSSDAIVPMWAYMLAVSHLQPYAKEIVFGDQKTLLNFIFLKNLSAINLQDYTGKRVVIKGCGDLPVSETAYVEITRLLRPVAKSIMYGEPCSTVPVYKQKQ